MRAAPLVLASAVAGCQGVQSALEPAGHEAEVLFGMFRIMLVGAVVIWLALNGMFFLFTRVWAGRMPARWGEALIIGGGIAFPTLGLLALLSYALPTMAGLRTPGAEPTVQLRGEQWWWRVRYHTEEGWIETANELRLPTGARTELALDAAKVIHSFWVPSLSGKLDMFPGRETRLAIEPFRTGVFRGQCAELCGDGHALMAFPTVVMEPAAFAAWLEAEAAPAAAPAGEQARRGERVFFAEGCAACHAVRGTPAEGRLGPDLTHVGSRETIGAGTLPNTVENFALWVSRTEEVKPGVRMPSYGHLDPAALDDLAHYLEGLD